jgi:hypothetical protein
MRRLLQSVLPFCVCCLLQQAVQAASILPTPLGATDLHLIERTTFGVNGSVATEFSRLGRDRWLDTQIHPAAKNRLPAPAQAIIDGLPISATPPNELAISLAAQARAANQIQDPEQKRAAQQAYQQALADIARQAATRSLLRDLYSPDQLREKMTWFWMNHFQCLSIQSRHPSVHRRL